MVYYLPHSPKFYGKAFAGFSSDGQAIANHTIYRKGKHVAVKPKALTLKAPHPRNFIKVNENLNIEDLWLIDRVKSEEPVVQITDHRNLSGENPLSGRTPIGEQPRFPDVSKIYSKKVLGVPQREVSTVGCKRFSGARGEDVSEVATHVGLCASYAGIQVVGIGWNSALDGRGTHLNRILSVNRSL